MELQTGTIVDRYAVEGLLGQGGMAIVYRVRHQQLGTPHALKVLMLPAKSIRERLLQEGRVQARLRHPNIVSVTDVVDVDGAPGLVMEYIPGPSLDELLRQHDLSVDQADLIGRGILDGVAAAHEVGLVHRDLKPGNVLLEVRKDRLIPKITDFGLAKILDDDEGSGGKTRSGLAMGTPCYMAPEQIRNAKGVDHRADVFSLGAVLYELITGRRAFDGDDTFEIFSAVTSGEYVPIRDLVPEAPERMVETVRRALATDRDERIQSVEELARLWAEGTPAPTAATAFEPAFIQRAEELGSGADEVPISWSPSVPTKEQVGVSVGPGGETMDWSLENDDAPDAPSIAPAPAPQPVQASNRDPSIRRRILLLGAAVTIAFVGLLSVGVIGGGVMLVRSPVEKAEEDATSVVVEKREARQRRSTPASTEDDRVPAPDAQPAPTPTPTPEAKPEARPDPTPTPETKPAPAPVEEPAEDPGEDEAPVDAEPEEEPAGEEAPEVPMGRVELKTAMHPMAKGASVIATVWLVSVDDRHELPGIVPAGNYRIEASFNNKPAVDLGPLEVRPDSTITLNCYSTIRECRL